jgi:hypothetical protein
MLSQHHCIGKAWQNDMHPSGIHYKKGSVLTGVYGKKKRPSTSFDFLFSRAKLARAAQ